ncbi:HLH [Musa troglodytarum]|uniref:HLH n=1 Tax=Musa troglodytarum TaxID=320322 RepID=A0A9E7GIK1_9LILI|nr:HLH [Musa troglodytarum]
MMGRSPSLWSMNNNLMPPSQEMSTLLASSSSSPSPLSSSVFPRYPKPAGFAPMIPCHESQELPESWSRLLLGGLEEEEEGRNHTGNFPVKRMENWEYQLPYTPANAHMIDVKQEGSEVGHHAYYLGKEQRAQGGRSSWSQMVPASSPRSCVTTSFSNNILDFSNCKSQRKHHQSDLSSECNSNSGAALKKARVQTSSAQSSLKVRKEKLGDRIAALHQLVSPFGKTDTASVLLEAIGYIRFLQGQIERLIPLHPIPNPLLHAGSELPVPGQQIKEHEAVHNSKFHVLSCTSMHAWRFYCLSCELNSGMLVFQGKGERSRIFVEDPGVQLLSADSCMKRRGPPADQDDGGGGGGDGDEDEDEPKDLRSRGLCLVPVSFTLHVGNDNGADFWAPNLGMGFQ